MPFAAFASDPDEATQSAIDNYLAALKNPSNDIQLDALKKLNDLKTLYPDYSMKEFDGYLISSVMKNSTQAWKNALFSELPTVRHSTLHVLVQFKSDFPNVDMSTFNIDLKRVINKDPDVHIQVDAKICHAFINSDELATMIKFDIGKESGPGDIFTQIHTQMDIIFHEKNPEALSAQSDS